MSILADFKNINSSRKELKKFGFTIGIALVMIGIYLWFRHRNGFMSLWGISALFILSALGQPKLLWPFHKLWMGLSVILGFFMTRLVLGILYYFIITPIGLISRLLGKDFLDLKQDPHTESYWKLNDKRIREKSSYENQF
jgi:multisubunit Na+/H+ antiporter MnhG subunit